MHIISNEKIHDKTNVNGDIASIFGNKDHEQQYAVIDSEDGVESPIL